MAQTESVNVAVVGLEAGVACLAVGGVAAVAPLALAAARPGKARAAETPACGLVTPHHLRALEIAVALCWVKRESEGGEPL